jgi:hypothetical protein
MATQSIPSQIVCDQSFFYYHRSLDLGHPIDNGLISPLIWQQKLVLPSNKKQTLQSKFTFFFEVHGPCVLTPTIAIYLWKKG